MAEPAKYRTHNVTRQERADGSVILQSGYDLPPIAATSADWLHRWANERPNTPFLAERNGPGWRAITYGETLDQVRRIAAALLDRGLTSDTPLLIISGNGVDHGILTLAAHYVGIPTVPVAEQYSLIPGAQKQLQYVIKLIRPQMVYAVDGARFGTAFALDEMAGLDIVVSQNAGPGMHSFDDLLRGGTSDVTAAAAQVGPDSIVKILMTSGSTSHPKGVLTTHRMMCANQAQNAGGMPFLTQRPPRIVDWLPWNHVFGGSNNFNLILANGGSLYIDDGKPAKPLIGKTIENNLLMNATIAYNVPVGFAMLRDEMRHNTALQENYFKDLDMIFYAGASLPKDVWDDLVDMAIAVRGDPPLVTTCWGLTETAPACIFQHEPAPMPGMLGVPLPGVTVKLVPENLPRYDVRIKGPNVTAGYFRDTVKTQAAFDDEGFFITGDAMTFVDPDDDNKGLRFDGRISEDFKLATGIWVRAAALRLDLLVALAPLAADVIITGEGHTEVGLLIVPAPGLVADGKLIEDRGVYHGGTIQAEIVDRLKTIAATAAGSSNRITRAMVLSEPPSMADGEITAKGNLNLRKLLIRRVNVLDRLYSDDDPAVIHI